MNPDDISIMIKEILSLRYYPSLQIGRKKITSNDFQSQDNLDYLEHIENLILSTIESEVKGEKISVALSGGVDSTLVLSLIRKIKPDINIEAVSIKFADSVDETTTASKIAETFDANHNIVYLENYLSELPKAISMVKLPFWDLHWYYVAKKAQTFSKYLAAGDGGDEVFGGYTVRYAKFLSLINPKATALEKVKAYLKCHERDSVTDQEEVFGEHITFSWDLIYEQILPYFDNSLSVLDQVLLADYNGKLMYHFSPINNKINNYFDLTSITPLLSNNIISYATNLQSKSKYDEINNIGKIPLHQLLKKYNLDSLVLNTKQGFSVDTLNLWKSYAQKLCKDYLSNSRVVRDRWINGDWIKKYIDRSDLDVRYVNKFLGLLAFEVWYRLFVSKEMKSETNLS